MVEAIKPIQSKAGMGPEIEYTLEVESNGAPSRHRLRPGDRKLFGRDPVCQIHVTDPQLSRLHAEFAWEEDGPVLRDLGSSNGCFVNGMRISESSIREGDVLFLGDIRMTVGIETRGATWDLASVHRRLLDRLNLRELNDASIADPDFRERVRRLATELATADQPNAPLEEKERFVNSVLEEVFGLGPLETFLEDDDVTEIMVNAPDEVWLEQQGTLSKSEKTFSGEAAVRRVIDRIVAPLGRRVDESSPLVDARLKDGSRVNAVVPPIALKGPALTIRKFRKQRITPDDLLKWGTLDESGLRILSDAVEARKNIIVSGGTGAGKTTLLNVLSSYIGDGERIITIEDAAELQLSQPHVVRLETRPPNLEGKGTITIRDLLKNALRMRPDRIIVGECRGGEALDMLQAMNTGHDGSLSTVHANSPADALKRLETLVLFAGMELPHRAVREQVASAIHIVVQQDRLKTGARAVTSIVRVRGLEGDEYRTQEIWNHREGRQAS